MQQLITIYTSNRPLDCHIRKLRLEADGIRCFVFDEHMIYVHPFYAIAIGGAKLKVPEDVMSEAMELLQQAVEPALLQEEMRKAEEILELRDSIRQNPSLAEKLRGKPDWISEEQMNHLISEEEEFQDEKGKVFHFEWKRFWYELFDFDRSLRAYLRPRKTAFYLFRDEVDSYMNQNYYSSKCNCECPACGSSDVFYTFPGKRKAEIAYLVLSLLSAPFPVFFKRKHCFDCGKEF